MRPTDDQLVEAFEEAAQTLIAAIKAGKMRKFVTNYLREYARAAKGYRFSNTKSPEILRELVRRKPELAKWIDLATTWT